jgi:hypothetical protein
VKVDGIDLPEAVGQHISRRACERIGCKGGDGRSEIFFSHIYAPADYRERSRAYEPGAGFVDLPPLPAPFLLFLLFGFLRVIFSRSFVSFLIPFGRLFFVIYYFFFLIGIFFYSLCCC